MKPRVKVLKADDDDALILPRELIVQAASAAEGSRLIHAKRQWYIEHGVDPRDSRATSEVWQQSGRFYGVPLSAFDRYCADQVGLDEWQRIHGSVSASTS